MARSSTASEPLRLLLLALLACCAAGASVCDTAICGNGYCTELPELSAGLLSYECHCEHGWSQPEALKAFPMAPCIVPNCTFDDACLNLSLSPPTGIPTDVCDVVSCGAGGTCKLGGASLLSYTCECQPGYANMLNLTTLPCAKNCFHGKACYDLGLAPAPAPASQPSPSPSPSPPLPPAPTGNHDSSGTSSAPPSGTQGSVASWRLPQLLLLVALAMAHVM